MIVLIHDHYQLDQLLIYGREDQTLLGIAQSLKPFEDGQVLFLEFFPTAKDAWLGKKVSGVGLGRFRLIVH